MDIMKGVAILTAGRSGSNWLGSLANSTHCLGRSDEWLDPLTLGSDPRDIDALFQAILATASSANGRFALKIFPPHLMRVQRQYGVDFITECRSRHHLGLVLLKRRDRLRQAISLVRSVQTNKWTSAESAIGAEAYDYAAICEAYVKTERYYSFWSAYLDLFELDHDLLYYEDLVDDPAPYLDALSKHLEVRIDDVPVSALKVQRDDLTEEWLARFRLDLARVGFLSQLPKGATPRTVRNLALFLQRKPMKGHWFD